MQYDIPSDQNTSPKLKLIINMILCIIANFESLLNIKRHSILAITSRTTLCTLFHKSYYLLCFCTEEDFIIDVLIAFNDSYLIHSILNSQHCIMSLLLPPRWEELFSP